jgi:hypothetical protein
LIGARALLRRVPARRAARRRAVTEKVIARWSKDYADKDALRTHLLDHRPFLGGQMPVTVTHSNTLPVRDTLTDLIPGRVLHLCLEDRATHRA